MGCSGSKLDSQGSVSLCRGRFDLLAEAIRYRYSLIAAHAAYSSSLLSLASSLHRFLSPVLSLPSHCKADSPPSPPPPISSPATPTLIPAPPSTSPMTTTMVVAAAPSPTMLSAMLEVGKQPYYDNSSVYEVSSRMVYATTPSTPKGGD